jgi:predicted nucleic acid-binding protein
LTSDVKFWKQVIKRQGLMAALLQRKGGKKNLKRLRVMQKTYTTSLVKKTTDEIQQTTADLIDNVKQQAWQQIVATFKTQSDCEHLTVQ